MNRIVGTFGGLVVVLSLALSPASASAEGIDGKDVFMKKCKVCHGEDGNRTPVGEKKGTPEKLAPELEKHTVEELVKVVTEGKEKMPAFKDKLTAEEIDTVVRWAKDNIK